MVGPLPQCCDSPSYWRLSSNNGSRVRRSLSSGSSSSGIDLSDRQAPGSPPHKLRSGGTTRVHSYSRGVRVLDSVTSLWSESPQYLAPGGGSDSKSGTSREADAADAAASLSPPVPALLSRAAAAYDGETAGHGRCIPRDAEPFQPRLVSSDHQTAGRAGWSSWRCLVCEAMKYTAEPPREAGDAANPVLKL